VLAHLLVTEGFASIEQVAFVPLGELTGIEGFDEDIAQELSSRAEAYLAEQAEKFAATCRELGIAADLAELPALSSDMVVALANAGIKTLDQLAELAGYELSGSEEDGEEGVLKEFEITESDGNAIIMEARAHWYPDEPAEEDAAAEGEGEGEESEEGEDTAAGTEVSEAEAATSEAAPAQSAGDQEKPETEAATSEAAPAQSADDQEKPETEA
jgi:N utilization substance protein A